MTPATPLEVAGWALIVIASCGQDKRMRLAALVLAAVCIPLSLVLRFA